MTLEPGNYRQNYTQPQPIRVDVVKKSSGEFLGEVIGKAFAIAIFASLAILALVFIWWLIGLML